MQTECINPNFYVYIIPGTVFSKERKRKANNNPENVRKDIDPCDVYGSLVQQPPNGHIVTLLRFIWSNVFTYYSCGEKFYHQGYPDALGDLIVVLKTKRVFDNPATHERTQSNKISNVCYNFKFECIFAHDCCFALQLKEEVKMCLEKVSYHTEFSMYNTVVKLEKNIFSVR